MPVAKMTSTIFKYLGKKPSTRRYPFFKRPAYTNQRGKIVIEFQYVFIAAFACDAALPNAIFISIKEKVFTMDHFRCVNCKACVELCPKKCLYMQTEQALPSVKGTGPRPQP